MPGPLRYVTPAEPATGRVAQVHAQVATDFGLARAPTFQTLSPAPDLMAATWALLREAVLAGDAPRTGKEVVATGVSLANRCPFCVDAHTMMLHATGDHRLAETIARGDVPADPAHARLLAWARATPDRDAAELVAPPFPRSLAAEYVGTALAFHFINRMVSALLTEHVLPGNLQRLRLVRRVGGQAFARTVRRRLPAGESLPLLAGRPGPAPSWAAGTPTGTAYTALLAAAQDGGALLTGPARAVVRDVVGGWDGAHPPVARGWLDEPTGSLPATDQAGARLALLAALAPYRVTDADVTAWRVTNPADADLVRLLAFGAMTAVTHIEKSISRKTLTR